jgi:phosphoglycolate phosphatase
MTRLIIFDLDGTLINAYAAVAKSVNYTLKNLGFTAKSAYEIKRAVGFGDRQLMVHFVGEEKADQALALYRPHHVKALKTGTKFLPGACSVLKWAKDEGSMLAIATNRPSMFTEEILQGLKVRELFDKVLCADQAKRPKPHPDMLWKICRELNVKREEAWYVGDMTIDLECGEKAKIKTVGVATGSSTKKELKKLKPYQIIDNINQLKKLISIH